MSMSYSFNKDKIRTNSEMTIYKVKQLGQILNNLQLHIQLEGPVHRYNGIYVF